jgi:polyferredoxin
MKRQKIRKLIIIVAMLLFPITIYYFSPYVIIQGALEGVITGSFIVFTTMFISSLFFGRLICAYVCPAGGIQECASLINDNNPKQGWRNNIKYVIWVIWILGVITSFVVSGKAPKINFFYFTDHGISIANIYAYVIYYGIVFLIFVPSVLFGKRIFCHYLCWMAPFMVIGDKIRNKLHIKGLRLVSEKEKCISCKICDKHCPMSLSVCENVQNQQMNDSECILCGACIDSCPKCVIKYKF